MGQPPGVQPGEFFPEAKEKRHPYSFIPFGTGPRQCIGMRLALLEIKLAFDESHAAIQV